MKKILIFILTAAFAACSLCSCGGASNDEIAGNYVIKDNAYYAAISQMAFNETDAYEVKEEEGKLQLLYHSQGISGESVVRECGTLKKTALRKSNFDKLILGGVWSEGLSAETLRKSVKAAWSAEDDEGDVYYMLLLESGEVMVARFKTKEGESSCVYIRKLAEK